MRNQFLQTTLLLLALCLSSTLSLAQEKMSFEETLFNVKEIMSTSDEQAATTRRQAKLDAALVGFLETDFMTKFKEIRLEAESLAATFKAHQMDFQASEVTKVRKSYTAIANKFNLKLRDIKYDFLNKKKLNMIRKYPDMYSGNLENSLRELQDEYSQTFERDVADVTGSDTYAAGPLVAIFGIIKLAVEFTDYLTRVRYDARRMKEEHLDMYLIEAFSFRPWDDIMASEGNTEKPYEEEEEYYDEEEEHGLNPFGETKTKKKKKKN
ncbi:MAG: hypothetical protein HRU41_35005 [Saprospiraceae bacterium]|nr:hypothetical protein [Saprospiraceae bacterium]